MLKTFKILILLVATLFTILPNTSCGESGIKLSFDTQLLNLLKKVDINSKVANMTLLGEEGITYEKKNFPSVYLKVLNLTINKIKNPEDISIDNDKQNKFLQIKFKNFDVELKASYDLKIASFLNDHGKNTLIKVELEHFLIGFQFTNEKILIKTFDFKIKHVDFTLNQWVLNLLKKLFMGMVIKKINQSVDSFKLALEEKLNTAINSKYIIDLGGMGIGINSTITENPDMEVYQIKNNARYSFTSNTNTNTMDKVEKLFDIFSDLFEQNKGKKIY